MNGYVPSYNHNQNQTFPSSYQAIQYFPQPQGSIYMIASSNDVANVPVGVGLSAAICLREGIIYLKTIQNGSPMLLGYRLSPLENNSIEQPSSQNASTPLAPPMQQEPSWEQRIVSILENLESRLKILENPGNEKQKGGTPEWQL